MHKYFMWTFLAVGMLLEGGVGSASESDQAPAIDKGLTLEEVVVTARKREENLDKVPISIAVFDQAALQQLGIKDINGIANISPGVDFQDEGPINRIAIRGISIGYLGSGYATVGTYIDDVPIQTRVSSIIDTMGNAEPKVFDLDRVEVLRGPQGTLFGAGAEGGAIRFITSQPSLTEYSGYSRAELATTDGGDPSYETGVAFGGPIVQDELGFRVSAWHRRDGGYIDHESAIPGGYYYDNSNWTDSDVLRAALTFAPVDSVKITPSVYYQHVYSHDIPMFEPAGSASPGDVFTSFLSGLGPQYSNVGAGRFVNPELEQEPSSDQFYVPALKAVFDLAAFEVTSSTGYLYRNNTSHEDFTTDTPGIFGFPWQTTAAAADYNSVSTNQNVFSQELRAQNADANQRLQWTLGLFYTQSRQKLYNLERSPDLPNLIQTYFGEPIGTYLGTNLVQPGNLSYIGDEHDTDTQAAVFGQVTYHLINHLSLTAGARVARERTQYSVFQGAVYAAPPVAGEQSEHVVDPKFGVNLQLDDNNLLYVSASKGDRIGGVNSPLEAFGQCLVALEALGLHGAPNTYQGDSLWSYEVGSKNRLMGGRLQLEASAFHIDWSNVQQNIYVPACSEGFISNLGKAKSNGFDFVVNVLVTDALKLGVSVGYTNAKFANTVTSGEKQIVTSGDQINPYSAPWTVVPTLEYDFPFAQSYKGYLRLDDEYHSRNPGPFGESNPNNASYFGSFASGSAFIPNPAINTLNIRVGGTWARWDVSVYALNTLNNHPLLYNQQFIAVQNPGTAFTLRPLTIGIASAYRW
jgi:outer membrane receptor protein involved in Fe transport